MKKDDISFKARLVRNGINFVTSQYIIGPAIKKGTLRKKWKEPKWRCPDGYTMTNIKYKKFNMELLTPPEIKSEKIILQFHGGGYVGKTCNIHREFAYKYSQMYGGVKVLLVDYRVAPKHPFPAAFDDAVDAYKWLISIGYKGEDIIVAGDSAGGGLTLALAQYLRDNDMEQPGALVLMSPWTDQTASGSSYEENYKIDPMFGNTRDSMIYNGEYYMDNEPDNPYISPLFGSFKGLPKMLFQVGSMEMLLSDSVDAAKKAEEAGCDVKITVYEGMFHVFQMGLDVLEESRNAWEEVRNFIESV